jgi:hypothetical protein
VSFVKLFDGLCVFVRSFVRSSSPLFVRSSSPLFGLQISDICVLKVLYSFAVTCVRTSGGVAFS